MALFGNKNSANVCAPDASYNKSISNLLLVVVFSAINIVMLATNAGSYFLFSAFIPYFIVDYGMYWCGMFPEDIYADSPGIEAEFLDKSFLGITIAIAVVIILVYLLCWFLARKKKVGALILALVFFVIDTIGMFFVYGFAMDSIIDIIFHIWVIVSLTIGVVTYFKNKKASETQGFVVNDFNENAPVAEAVPVKETATLNGVEVTTSGEGKNIEE